MMNTPSIKEEVKSLATETLRRMYRCRFVDEKMSKLVRQNKGGTFHLSSKGHELIGVVAALCMESKKDWAFPYYRDRPFVLGLGVEMEELFAAFLARDIPHHSGGRMMPEHFSHKEFKIPCQSSCVGSQFLQAVGVAQGVKINGGDEIVYVSSGDGATSQGDFHEALNYAAIHRLSVLFVVQDNGWAISVPKEQQSAGGSIHERCEGYHGLWVDTVDGCDFEAVRQSCLRGVERGRKKEGPSLIIAHVPRLGPHSSSDDPTKYKSTSVITEEIARDPLPRYEAWIEKEELLTSSEVEALKQEVFEEVEHAAAMADKVPFPSPVGIEETVFMPTQEEGLAISSPTTGEAIVMVDALNHALKEEMEKDAGVIVFGQDVAWGKGGVFGVTRYLTDLYGEKRCFNTPLAESTIIGLAIGLGFMGLRSVAEVQFADYMWTGANQLFNELASMYFRSNGEWNCPVVIRMPCGGYIQGGPYHSQSIEAFLAHCPGLKIVIPSHAADAKKLLKSAIRDPNPVVFLEHKALYRQRAFCARTEPGVEETLSLGKAALLQEGDELTVVAWGMMVPMVYEIAGTLRKEGYSIEVIDLRTIVPCDYETIEASVKKTGKLLIVHEASKTGGFGAEIAARMAKSAFTFLDAPIERVGALDCMVPYGKNLEDAVLPQKETVEASMRAILDY